MTRPDTDALRATIDALDREPWRAARAYVDRHARASAAVARALLIGVAILSVVAACCAAVETARRDAERQAAVERAEQIRSERTQP